MKVEVGESHVRSVLTHTVHLGGQNSSQIESF